MILLIIIGILIVAIEIFIDKKLWKAGKSDKIITTIGRAVLIAIAGLLTPGIYWMNMLFIASVFFLLFDFSLNVSRWGELPIPYYQPYHSKLRQLRKDGYSIQSAEALAYDSLTFWQKILYKISLFTKRFFWHGDEETKSWYDLAFQRIPPLAELLIIKATVFGIAIYYYY